MTSSRRPIFRAATLAAEHMAVPLRDAPGPLTLAGAGGPAALAANAEAEARAIVAEAEMLREQIVADAWNEGYRQGVDEARSQMTHVLEAAEAMASALSEQLDRLPDALAAETGAMALEVAARVVRAELHARPERVLDVVRTAIRRATDRERLLVHVNPDDLAVVREGAPDMAARIGGTGRLEVVDDPRIPRGGCIVETGGGDVDARLATQMSRMLEALAEDPDDSLVEQEPR